MEAKLHQSFDSWQKGPAALRLQLSFHGPKPGIYFAEKGDVTASMVMMVDLGITRDNPDYYAIEVFNQFFGGSLSSRLFSNIRSKKGLAYAVGGGIEADYDHPGTLGLFLGTKSHSTAAAIDAFNEELDALKINPRTPEELTRATARYPEFVCVPLRLEGKSPARAYGLRILPLSRGFLGNIPHRHRKGHTTRRRSRSPEVCPQGQTGGAGGWEGGGLRSASVIIRPGDHPGYHDSAASRSAEVKQEAVADSIGVQSQPTVPPWLQVLSRITVLKPT